MPEKLHEFESDTGSTVVMRDSKGNVRIDSYFGDRKASGEHDRVSLNTHTGRFSGHNEDKSEKFDSEK